MHVTNEDQWSAQLVEFEADETSRRFRDFLVFWFETAEAIYGENNSETSVMGVDHCVRQAFVIAEGELGYLSMEWVGQMLLVASGHWVHGAQLVAGLTPLESRMLEQMSAVKLVELQASATIPVDESK